MCRSLVGVIPRFGLSYVFVLAMTAIGWTPASVEPIRCGESLEGAAPDTAGEWRAFSDMSRPRSELSAAVVDDWIYIAGGFGGLAQVDCFHPASGTWATATDLPVGVHHPGVAALEGVLYVAGGYTDAGGATDALWAFDPETASWEERAPMPTARGALGLAALDGRLYAVGGATDHLGGPATGAVEVYDPRTDGWTSGADMPTPREHLAVAASEVRIFAVGGRANGDESDALAAAVEAYDPVTDRWESLPVLPTPRGGVSGVFADGRMVVLGGERGTTTYDTVEAFNPATGTWSQLPAIPTPRHGLASAAIGDTIYAIAGSTQAGAAENTGANEALTLPSLIPSGSPEAIGGTQAEVTGLR